MYFSQLHYKYNRNLVDEGHQELTEHLHRRHLNAQRMSRLASATLPMPMYMSQDGEDQAEESVSIRNHSAASNSFSAPIRGIDDDTTSLLPGVPTRPTTG